MKKLLMSVALLAIACSSNATTNNNPLASENKDVANFGIQVAAMGLSYAKAVRHENGKTIVDVVVLDKLCHVTVQESGDQFKAEKLACDDGKYFDSSK